MDTLEYLMQVLLLDDQLDSLVFFDDKIFSIPPSDQNLS